MSHDSQLLRADQFDWMALALEQARRGLESGEAPIGSVVLRRSGELMGAAYNTCLSSGNPTAHAEMNAFASAAGKFEHADDLLLVTTLEPCVMCTGAAMQVGVTRIIYGLQAPADAGTGRVSPPTSPGATNPTVVGDVRADESRAIFLEWMKKHSGDASRSTQRKFIEQLLALTDHAISSNTRNGAAAR